jgi:hypothetical protein
MVSLQPSSLIRTSSRDEQGARFLTQDMTKMIEDFAKDGEEIFVTVSRFGEHAVISLRGRPR